MMSLQIPLKTLRLFKKFPSFVAPPPDYKISEWADTNRVLSAEGSSESGKFKTDRAPYQREMMDAACDDDVETIVIMTSAQIGKTEIINNIVGYFIDYDPCPIMMVMPTEALAKTWSKKRLTPMLRDTPCLRGKVADSKTRDGDNTILEKSFPGGYITMVGANSPVGLSSRPIRVVLADEVDRFPKSAGAEGDPLALAEKRTKTFWNRKKIFVSTPTDRGISRIEKEYEESTKETYQVPCPMCGKLQSFEWSRIKFKTVTMECRFCREDFEEHYWKRGKGIWVAANPEKRKKRGFHLNALASPWERWENIIEEFKSAKGKGKEALKTFINTYLGETWEDEAGDTLEHKQLFKRKEAYNAELPHGVLILTAGVDVQDNRLELEVVGWGKGKESWGIYYKSIYGDPKQKSVWERLDQYLLRTYEFTDGKKIPISCSCVDSGYLPDEVYKYCKPREHKKIFAIKGKGSYDTPYISNHSRNNRVGAALFTIGVDNGKEILLSNLNVKRDEEGMYPPGYCHFPLDKVDGESRGYNDKYFEGLCSEKRVITYRKGVATFKWVKVVKRNEPWDLRNYASAALEINGANFEMAEASLKRLRGETSNDSKGSKPKKKKKRTHSKGI